MNEPKLIKRKNFTEKIMGKQKIIFVVAVCLLITLFVSSSYALLTGFDVRNNAIVIKEGDMRMTINETDIKLVNESPISDYQGMRKSDTTVLTLSNTGNLNIKKYEVRLEGDKNSNLELSNIRYSYSTDFGVHYSDPMSLNNNIIYTGYNLLNNKSKTLYIKIWIDEKSSNTNGKNFYGKINVKLYQDSSVPYASNVVKESKDVTLIDNNYYYKNSNNYVMFNHELWRIVSVFNEDGVDKLRIVRNDNLDEKMVTDEYFVDDISYKLLNQDKTVNWNNALNRYLNEEVDGHGNRGYLGYISNEAKNMINGEFKLLAKDDIKGDWFKEFDKTIWLKNEVSSALVLTSGEVMNVEFDTTAYLQVAVDLNPRVVITSGDGTHDNPYLLSI